MQLDTTDVRALTFDCYGTIVDWDGGIRAALEAVPGLAGADFDRLVAEREAEEYELLAGPFRLYREVLGESMQRAARLQGFSPTDAERAEFTRSMGRWPMFPDSDAALVRLASRFQLAILSNVETATLDESLSGATAELAVRVTAEQIESYKPALEHFDTGLERLGLGQHQVLHVAGSLFHDIRPAIQLGWSTIWINRRGEPVPADIDPERVLPDLAGLADRLIG